MLCTEYLAGFFDGEGSIGIYPVMHHGRPGFYLRTQLVQNIGEASVALLAELTTVYGGNGPLESCSRCQRAFNWQLHGHSAARFLQAIEPSLRLKREQAEIAIAWQSQRPPIARNARGHIVFKTEPVLELDRQQVSEIVRELKRTTLSAVLARRPELRETARTLLGELPAPPSSQQSLRASASPTQLSLFHPTCTSAVQVVHTLRLSGR